MGPMRTDSIRRRFVPLAACTLLAIALPLLVRDLAAQGRLRSEDRTALLRAESVFTPEGGEAGEIPVEASYLFTGQTARGQQGSLTVVARLGEGRGELALGISLVVEDRDGATWIRHHEAAAAAGTDLWSFEAELELPGEIRDLVVVVEEIGSGRWGAAVADREEELAVPAGALASARAGLWSIFEEPVPAAGAAGRAGEERTAEAGSQDRGIEAGGPGSAADEGDEAGRGTVIRILAPRSRKLAGPTRIETLVSDFEVARVSFLLAGREVASDDKEPFEARIELAGPGTPQRLEVQAFDGAGHTLGTDALTLNETARSFRVHLARVEGVPSQGAITVEAEVSVPSRMVLDRVELYFNQDLAARFDAPPYQARIETPNATGQDFVRAVAYASDGTSVEDVALLGVEGVSEQLDVTLVELYTVVTDRDGHPVRDLQKEDFTLRYNGRRPAIERLSFATDVPLLLGLVIDTSASMETILLQTKQAAAQFLNQILGRGDRAFLVDFSTRPRLRHRATEKLMELIGAFRGMRADGATALYDSILFSLVEFTDGPGRRALVMLTDGDDYRSHFGPNRAIRDARRLGVPIYIIAFGAEGREGGISGTGRLELEAVTEQSGGRLYLIDRVEDLAAAYGEIEKELRSQYLLTFYAEGAPDDLDRREVAVEVRGKGREARVVVGAE